MADRWIPTREYALKYGLYHTTVSNWARAGKIKAIKKGRDWAIYDPNLFELANPNSRVITAEDLQPLIRGNEAAELAGISHRMLRHYAKAGKVGFRLDGRRRRYSVQDIRDIMAVRLFNKNRPTRQEKRISIMEWARMRLNQQNP